MKILHLWQRQWRDGRGAARRFAAGLCLFLAACTGSAAPDLRAQIDAQLEANASLHGIPAQSVLVMRNGEVLYRSQTGFADIESQRAVRPDDVYAVYSVSKLFVSTLILELVDQGRIDLEAPASRYIASLPPAWREARIEQLLNHASGLPDYFQGTDGRLDFPRTRDEVFRTLGEKPLDFPPGTQVRYNQTNYLVLQAVLERLHGMPYRQIVQRRIAEPLGLRDVYLGLANAPAGRLVSAYRGEGARLVPDPTVPWPDYSIAHAELFTTADDLGVFLTAVAQGRFARPQTLARLWRPYRQANGQRGDFASGWDYGESEGFREVGHDGGVKVRVRLIFRGDDLNDHYVIIYLTNGTREGVWTRRLVESIQPLVLQSD
ncbi:MULTISPECIES: serine hydrolase [unclassified Brevundimonas]|uniref:serine hydrolase domain-containing protein n=1 Tax=unclassified Brevundimonas TaxID=2622653 RepID=UPI0025B8FB05|nr:MULTISPECIES: serine hydrolase domain-containing protein [unclassified Brevundimonas]